jgi:hypothetical protein
MGRNSAVDPFNSKGFSLIIPPKMLARERRLAMDSVPLRQIQYPGTNGKNLMLKSQNKCEGYEVNVRFLATKRNGQRSRV